MKAMISSDKKNNAIRELAELAVITALMIGGKEVMNVLPNIHPVTLILILCVRIYGRKSLYPAVAFAFIEILLYGIGLWSVSYLYTWPLIAAAAIPFKDSDSRLFWAVYAGICGLLFGLLSSIPVLFISGWRASLVYWIAGIGFDIIHCISNFILVYIAEPILYKTLIKLHK